MGLNFLSQGQKRQQHVLSPLKTLVDMRQIQLINFVCNIQIQIAFKLIDKTS